MQIQEIVREELVERFLRYVAIDTESDPKSKTYPSTEKQLTLLALLRDELTSLGASEVQMDKYGYVTATIPASPGYEDKPVIGIIAHVDTSPDLSGANVRPQLDQSIGLGSLGVIKALRDFRGLAI